jgi:putative transposase
MVKNHHLAQSISDVAWNKFAEMLSYKAENAGKVVVRVNPRNTSREYKYGKLDRD